MSSPAEPLESADRPIESPGEGWKDVARATVGRLKEDQLTLLGAGVAFFGLLALIPTMIAAVSIYGLLSDPSDVERQITDLTTGLPEAARDLLAEQLDSIVASSAGALSLGAILGVLIALFSASSGVKQLIGALNVAYREQESRNIVELRGLSLLLTLAAILFAAFAIGAIAVIPAITSGTAVGDVAATVLSIARWPLLLAAFALGLAVLYKVGPDRQDPRLVWASPGALFATVVWVVGSGLFSFYVSRFGSYNETYGSLAGVVILMLWLFLTSTVIIVGAAINAELEHRTQSDTTTVEQPPLGQRDPEVADTTPSDDLSRR